MADILLGYTRYISKYGASYKIISLTPKKLLKTQIFEKAILSIERNLGQSFLILWNLTNLGNILRRSTRYSDNYCAVIRSFPQALSGRQKDCSKKAIFLAKKNPSTLSRITEHGKPQAKFF